MSSPPIQPAAFEIVVYGGTAGGLVAALTAARRGRRTALLMPEPRLGCMTTGGLGDTDVGVAGAIGGWARTFYEELGRRYGQSGPVWHFEAKVALDILTERLAASAVVFVPGVFLDRTPAGVRRAGPHLQAIRTTDGRWWQADTFIDATYEGDLLAAAGASFSIGRESRAEFGESLAGIWADNELPPGIDPWRIAGDPSSGLLPHVHPDAGGQPGDGDRQVQAYNYRMNLTDDPANRVAIEQPEGYNEAEYELLFRAIAAGQHSRFFKFNPLPNRKADSNNDSGISTDYNGHSHTYPEASESERAAIRARHRRWQFGYVWTVQHHPRVPAEIRARHLPWGLPRDEFTESGHFPAQLYVREARRLRGEVVITEHHVRRTEPVADPVALGSYAMDSHHMRYCVGADGCVRTEGGFYAPLKSPYPISYRALVPRREEVDNLLVTTCISATHAAYGSVRMEPVFMMLGEAAALAADLALAGGLRPAELPYPQLAEALREAGAVVDPALAVGAGNR